jgi:type II secretory pathway pseudopilin PulG
MWPRKSNAIRRRRAFTLIEAIVVVTLMALLTVAVTVSLRSAGRAARIEDVADAYAAFDRTTREAARRFGRTPEIRFELNRGNVRRVDEERDPVTLALRGGFRVTRVVVRGRDARSGEIAVPVSARGQTPSYAVLLAGPGGERWVMFAGLTGQPSVIQNERDVQDILSAVAGPDAG